MKRNTGACTVIRLGWPRALYSPLIDSLAHTAELALPPPLAAGEWPWNPALPLSRWEPSSPACPHLGLLFSTCCLILWQLSDQQLCSRLCLLCPPPPGEFVFQLWFLGTFQAAYMAHQILFANVYPSGHHVCGFGICQLAHLLNSSQGFSG